MVAVSTPYQAVLHLLVYCVCRLNNFFSNYNGNYKIPVADDGTEGTKFI
jgi:hypothetical protein